MPPQGTFTRMEAPWPKKSTGRPIGEIRAVHRPATGSVATQGTTGATFRGHRSDHRTPQDVAQERPQDTTGRSTGRPQDTTGGHRTGHRAAQEPPQGRHRQSQAGPHDTTGSPTGDTKGHPEDRRRGHCPQGTGPKPHGGMATRAPISPPEQSANRRLPVRVGGGRPVPHKQRRGVCPPVWPRPGPERPEALPEGVPRAGKVLRHRVFGGKWGSGVHALGGLLGAGWGWCWWESLDFGLF